MATIPYCHYAIRIFVLRDEFALTFKIQKTMEIKEIIEQRNAELHKQVEDYLAAHPREVMYGVTLTSTEDDSESTFYHPMTDDELALLRQWESLTDEQKSDYAHLEEFLSEQGRDDLVEKWLTHHSPFELNILHDCDTEHPLSFTKVLVHRIIDNKLQSKCYINVPLTDNEYIELIVLCLNHKDTVTMNMISAELPQIAAIINRHIMWALCDFVCESHHPFVFDITEIKETAEKISESESLA